MSVFDKRGVVDFARALSELGVEIISTGGTANELAQAGIDTTRSRRTPAFPRSSTAASRRFTRASTRACWRSARARSTARTLAEHGIAPIDLVCVNLYPFERTAARRGVTEQEVIEHIDIGGPTLIRAAAKNHAFVAVVVRPESYDAVIEELQETGGVLSAQTRESLATEAFGATARYDAAISRWFAEREEDFPNHFVAAFEKVLDLSYGENPHQRAAYYEQVGVRTHLLARTVEDARQGAVLQQPARPRLRPAPAARVRGARPARSSSTTTPAGCAVGENAIEAFERALACDPLSAYGGVVVFNREVDDDACRAAQRGLRRADLRAGIRRTRRSRSCAIEAPRAHHRGLRAPQGPPGERDLRRVAGGVLVQDRDTDLEDRAHMEVVTERKPTEEEWGELQFAWKVCKHVRSNAIVLSNELATIGIGAGQMSRVDSVRLAVEKARENRPEAIDGAVMASDAFFPFADGAEAGIAAGRQGRHPARRLEARSRGDRGLQQGRHRDGLHRPPALPPLTLHPPCQPENVDKVRRIYEAFGAREWDAGFTLVAEDLEWHQVGPFPDAKVYRGQGRSEGAPDRRVLDGVRRLPLRGRRADRLGRARGRGRHGARSRRQRPRVRTSIHPPLALP